MKPPNPIYPVGDVIDGKYVVEEQLGDGGMGFVARVRSSVDGSVVALKYCPDPDDKKRFAREVRIMQAISHRHVMPVLDANLDRDPPYFTMPVAICSLDKELPALAANESSALAAFKDICLGVQAIHSGGASHRDLKPLNALRMPDGRVVVSDLGLAKFENRDSTTITATFVVLGTLAYLAPEQQAPGGSRDADARTDVFQLGKTLYHILTNEFPTLMDFSRLPPGLGYIVQRATRPHPKDRYQSVGELLDAIENYTRAKDPEANPTRALADMIQQAEVLLQNNEYNADNLNKIISFMIHLSDSPETLVEWFDRIPERLLPIAAGLESSDFVDLMRIYAEAIDSQVADYNFSYAETVARKMKLIFAKASIPEIKSLALLATLSAAVRLRRYAAMDAFDTMLVQIQAPEDVGPVADMLRANSALYRAVAGRISKNELPFEIRKLHEDLS